MVEDVAAEVGGEPLAGLLKKLGSGLKVDLSGGHIDMAHIGGQGGKKGVDVPAFAIPGQEPGDSKGMTDVVQAGAGAALASDAALQQQFAEGLINRGMAQPTAELIDEQGGLGVGRRMAGTPLEPIWLL